MVLLGFSTIPGIGMVGCAEKPAANGMSKTVTLSTAGDGFVESARRSAPMAVVLFQTPTECLTCSADTYNWIELVREAGGALLIVLTEPPTAEEAAAIKRMRLNFTVIHEPFRSMPEVAPPAIAVFRGADTLLFEGHLTTLRRLKLLDSTRRLLQQK